MHNFNYKEYISIPIVWVICIFLVGFILDFGSVDAEGLRQGTVGIGGTKVIRSGSVVLASIVAFYLFFNSQSFHNLISGTNALLLCFILLCIASSMFSPVRALTLFKSFELLIILLLISRVHSYKNSYEMSKKIIIALMIIYSLTVLGVYFQMILLGKDVQRQLIGASYMLYSRYPAMAGNALGYLGAVVALFGVYVMSVKNLDTGKNRRRLGAIIFIMGIIVTYFSYTRSIMFFLFVSIFAYYAYRKRIIVNVVMILAIIVPLAIPQVQEKAANYFRRGSTDEQLMSMSGRTEMWGQVFDRSLIILTIGQGYSTGSRYMNYEKTGKLLDSRNVHNSFLEIVMSVGLLGGFIWLCILIRLIIQYYSFYKKSRHRISEDENNFHIFMMVLLFLSVTRSLMNTTFVYLDYFYFLFMAFIVYGDSLRGKLRELNTTKQDAPVLDVEDTKKQKRILHLK